MGTRADFYVGRGKDAEWIGSIAYDGYPEGMDEEQLFGASDADAFRACVRSMSERDDFTPPDMGWPWPWDDSRTTDYAYAFDDGQVWISSFGHPWMTHEQHSDKSFRDANYDEPKLDNFPDMAERKNVTMGPRSGLIVVTALP